MAWVTRKKDLAITDKTGHKNTNPVLIGRAPAISSIHFSPLELFGAAARCSYLNLIDPSIVTSESILVAALVEQHVDDISPDFAILPSADNLKDYIKSYFAGTIASGLAYLVMVSDGYVWSDHFENIGGGNSSVRKSPDFVFASPTAGVALVESKGTRAATLSGFDARVRDGYERQVEPHLGYAVGLAPASHGYCIGAYLKSTSNAELRIHYTTVTAQANPPAPPRNLSVIQRNSYATVFQLSHSERLAESIRKNRPLKEIAFLRFEWGGMAWLTSIAYEYWNRLFDRMAAQFPGHSPPIWNQAYQMRPRMLFAVEQSMALRALRRFLIDSDSEIESTRLSPLPVDVLANLTLHGNESGGTVFPDGLGVFSLGAKESEVTPVIWKSENGGHLS